MGANFKDCSLDYLADFWLDESGETVHINNMGMVLKMTWIIAELRQAARALFGARILRLTDSEVSVEVQERQARMLQGALGGSKELLILGEICLVRESLLASG